MTQTHRSKIERVSFSVFVCFVILCFALLCFVILCYPLLSFATHYHSLDIDETDFIGKFLAQPSVIAALGVQGHSWEQCSNVVCKIVLCLWIYIYIYILCFVLCCVVCILCFFFSRTLVFILFVHVSLFAIYFSHSSSPPFSR